MTYVGHSLILLEIKKKHTVSQSSAEAEYRSMTIIYCELKWLSLLKDLRIPISVPTPLFCDNQAA